MGTQKTRQICEGGQSDRNSLSWTCDFQNGNSSINDFGSETQQSNISRKQGFPKLREILRRTRQDSDGMDCPDIEFEYSDADTHLIEVAEWYSYTEENEFSLNRKSYQELMEEYGVHGKWIMLSELERKAVVMRLLEQVELSQRTQRLKGFRAMLYLVQGVFGECECEEEQQFWERQNVFLLYENGTFEIFVELLNMELDNGSAATSALRKPAISLADSVDLRLILSVLYTICEVLRLPQESDTDEMKRLRDSFKQELGQPTIGNELISVILLGMITRFCSGSAPHFPIKKILLLLWKVLLVSLGGTEELRVLKALYRESCDLAAEKEDTVEITRTMRAASPPASAADLIEAQMQRRVNRPYRRQPLVKQSSMDDSMAFQDLERDECNDEDLPEFSDSPFQMQKIQSNGGTEEYSQNLQVDNSSAYNEVDSSFGSGEDTPRPSSPVPPRFLEDSPSVHSNLPNKGLPWVPKVRQKDIDLFLNNTRVKFVGFPLSEDRTSTAGLPQPIHEGLRVLQQHKYVSLSEVQVAREEEIAQNPVSQPEDDIKQNSSEIFYRLVLPNLPQYMIALLKILLAAAPTSKAKTESINIISDVLPEEMPITVPQSMKLGLDVNRHKEIIVKAVSGIILLIQKHFKINHIYQFEFVNQHLVFANCIPLILKFFNQNIMSYVQSKNAISIIDFPSCVIGEQPELTSETLCSLQEIGDNQLFCWRNMFSCINLLRILNKLTKWKQSRIMMLVVFKSAPILKRALKVKHAMMQLYVLKLLKMQTKYLGRQWRKSNMKTMSAIYQKVRHRLNDDWAYGNDMDARPWDFQAEECALRAAVDRFNHRRYDKALNASNTLPANSNMASSSVISGGGNGGGGGGNGLSNTAAGLLADLEFDYEPVDNCVFSVLGRNLELTDEFKKNYEIWLNQEVFQATVNWDQLLCSKFI